jgi:hypothetical protein
MKYSVSLHFSYHKLQTEEKTAMILFSDDEDYLMFDDQSGKAYPSEDSSIFYNLSSSVDLLERFLELL